MPDADTQDLQARVDRLEATVRRLMQQMQRQTLVAVRTLAERENEYPSTYGGVKKLIERRGVPLRRADGSKKPQGSREQSYVSLTELEAGKELATQSVQRDAGLID